jgi:predicted esterase
MAMRICLLVFVLVPVAAGQSERLKLTFTEHNPLSERDLVCIRLGATVVPPPPHPTLSAEFDLTTEPFDVIVPPGYRSTTPHGIFVWMGVTDPSPEWFDVLARQKLIFMDGRATNAAVEHVAWRKPLDGVFNLQKRYNIDANRIYIAGFSGGASAASFAITAFPDAYRGALLMMGGGFYPSAINDAGKTIPTDEPRMPWRQDLLDDMKQNAPLVLMYGARDPKASHTPPHYHGLLLDGFVRPTLMEVPGIGHQHPNAQWFAKAINALDRPVIKKPPTTAPTTAPSPSPGQVAQAERYLARAIYWDRGPGKRSMREARAKVALEQVVADYPTTPAAAKARRMLAKLQVTTRAAPAE